MQGAGLIFHRVPTNWVFPVSAISAFMQKPIRTYLMFNVALHSKLDVGYLSSPTSNHWGIPVTDGGANVLKNYVQGNKWSKLLLA